MIATAEQRSCRACGYSYSRNTFGDCCSARCAEYLDEGWPSKAEQQRRDDPFCDRDRFGPTGIFTTCRGCGGRFESRGLRLCPDCYPVLGDKGDLKRYGNQSRAGRCVKKATCPECGGDVPAYGKGGRKSMAEYCSIRCKSRAARGRVSSGVTAETIDGSRSPESRIATHRETATSAGGFVTREIPAGACCASCGKTVPKIRNGRPRRFCSPACKQRAYRDRPDTPTAPTVEIMGVADVR